MQAFIWRKYTRYAAFLFDLICIPISWVGAYWLRFNLSVIPADVLHDGLLALPIVLLLQTLAFWYFGLYRGVWRFASLPDLSRIVKAILVGSLFSLLGIFWVMRLHHMPRSVLPLYSMLMLLGLGGARFGVRRLKDQKSLFKKSLQRVLIVGVGRAGDSLARDLLHDNKGYIPVAFIDDTGQKVGREMHGIRIAGGSQDIFKISKEYAVDIIMIALPAANAAKMRDIVGICESTKLPVRTLPAINDLVSGAVTVNSLREISLEDLLGRAQVSLDWKAIGEALSGQIVLVSGGGGSIGSELCRQILRQKPKVLIVLDNSEYNLFQLEQQFVNDHYAKEVEVRYHLADCCDIPALSNLVSRYHPTIIFHAAAYKHVPMLQGQVRAAIHNNVLGTYALSWVAAEFGVKQFVLVSTDKAVNPTNVMGATKRAAELVCQYFNLLHKTRYITVRFGNVLGSRGSVVEIFRRQLEQGGPITITHPDITRYFMTIGEAAQLILQALAIGEGGELFVLDMGEPVKIRFMAEQMIRLAGKSLEEIPIKHIGLRPGEKLFEELFLPEEYFGKTRHPKILNAKQAKLSLDIFEKQLLDLKEACAEIDEEKCLFLLKKMVPELIDSRENLKTSSSDGAVAILEAV